MQACPARRRQAAAAPWRWQQRGSRYAFLELPGWNGGECSRAARSGLLDLGFLVGHVLAHDRIVLADLHLLGMQALVLGRGVEVTGAGARNELDLVAHGIDLRRVCRPRGVSRPPCRAPASRACAARASTGAASPSVPRPR